MGSSKKTADQKLKKKKIVSLQMEEKKLFIK